MNILLKVKKIGNHWYPNIQHDDPTTIVLDTKIEKLLNILDKEHTGSLDFLLLEMHSWLDANVIQFNDEDFWRWMNTTDCFDVRMYIRDHEFVVSSMLLDLFEEQFDTNFYETIYSLELCNIF